MNSNLLPAIFNILVGIIFLALSVPLVKRKVKMNSIYGFRTSKAFMSEENWYNINAYFGKHLSAWSILVILVGIVCIFVPVNRDLNLLVGMGPIVISSVVSVVTTLIYEHRL